MSEGKMLKNMPTEIIMNIQSFLLGEPHLYKIKRNPTLKAIQNKYKIKYTEPRVWNNLYINQTQMDYEMRLNNIKPHMINTTTNVNRIVNFINHYQYGVPEDYGEDETEEFNLDDDVYDDVEIDDDNPLKVKIELSLIYKLNTLFNGEIMNLNQHITTNYFLEIPTKRLVSKALLSFIQDCQCLKRKLERKIETNEILGFNFTHFEFLVFLKRDDDSDDEDSDHDHSDSDED